MILTVTLNPALDLTYAVAALRPGDVHRVDVVGARPGGKGLNVAGVLASLGRPVRATGLLGGGTGEQIGALLERSDVDSSFVPIAAESRRTVVVSSDVDLTTGLWEPGPIVTEAEWAAFRRHFEELLAGVTVVALAGSLPRGIPTDGYATLARTARERRARVVLDADGPALLEGLRAGPDVVKPNRLELAGATGQPVGTADEALRGGGVARSWAYRRGGLARRRRPGFLHSGGTVDGLTRPASRGQPDRGR